MTRVGNPDRREIASPQLLDQTERIAPVSLHSLAGLLRNERRRHHHAFVPKPLDLPVEPVAGRPRLVAERQTLVLGRKLPHKLARRRPRVVDLAEKPYLARSTAFRNRHSIA